MDTDFNEEYSETIGVDFGGFNVKFDGKITKLQIWDTAGSD